MSDKPSGPIPSVRIDARGTCTALDAAGRAVLGEAPGLYKAMRAGSLLFLALDEGTGAGPRDGESLIVAGSLRSGALLGILNLFAQNRDSGRLVLKRDKVERVIMLRQGDVASVGSNSAEDRIGRFLARLGKVSDEHLEAADAEAQSTNKRIGQVLIAHGVIGAHELWSCIQAQVTEIFSDVVQWPDGSFVVYRLPVDFNFPSTPPISMQMLLLDALRRADELSVFRERISDRDVLFCPTGREAPPELDDLARRALEAMGPRASVADLCKRLHVTEFDGTRACFDLLRRKLIERAVLEPEPLAVELADDHRAFIDVYNLAFREIVAEMERSGKVQLFISSVEKYLAEPSIAHAMLFFGVVPDEAGALPVERLLTNLARLECEDPVSFLQEALNELTFFMLFQCGEFLDAQSDENLGRRVRLIHAALSAPPTAVKPA
jgi:hypothetical protein